MVARLDPAVCRVAPRYVKCDSPWRLPHGNTGLSPGHHLVEKTRTPTRSRSC